jgi:hypothetical protein
VDNIIYYKIIETRDKQQFQYIERPTKVQAIITGIPQAQIYYPYQDTLQQN